MQGLQKSLAPSQFPRQRNRREPFCAGLRRTRPRERDPLPWSRSPRDYTWDCLVVHRGRVCRIACQHSSRIIRDGPREAKNGRVVGRGAHAANGHSYHQPREHVKLPRAHLAVEEIVHVGVSDKVSEGIASGNVVYNGSGQVPFARAEDVDRPEGQGIRGKTKTIVAKLQIPLVPGWSYARQSFIRTK